MIGLKVFQPWEAEIHELSEGISGIVYDANGQAVADHLSPERANLIAAAPSLYEAGRKVLDHLNARIDAADLSAVPIFEGIAELHDALARARGEAG